MEVSNRMESAEFWDVAPISPITGESPTAVWLIRAKGPLSFRDNSRRRLVALKVGRRVEIAAMTNRAAGYCIFLRLILCKTTKFFLWIGEVAEMS